MPPSDSLLLELRRLWTTSDQHTKEIRRLRTWRQQVGSGLGLRASQIVGVIPPGSGGAGSSGGSGSVDLWTNNSGAPLAEGDVVRWAGGRLTDLAAFIEADNIIGVVVDATVAAGAEARVRHQGYAPKVRVHGVVTQGQYLRNYAAGDSAAEDMGPQPGQGAFAIALSGAAGPGYGFVDAYLLGHAFDLPAIPRPLSVVTAGAAAVPWAAMPAASTELFGLSIHRVKIDSTKVFDVTLVVNVSNPGFAGSTLSAEYSDDGGANWFALDCASGPTVAIDAAGIFTATTIPNYICSYDPNALFRIVGAGGNGVVTPTFGNIYLLLQ